MRYHLWYAFTSRQKPWGVRDSNAVTGAHRPVPYWAVLGGSGGCSEGYSQRHPLPRRTDPGALWAGTRSANILFLAVREL